jgi:ribosomal protein L34E
VAEFTVCPAPLKTLGAVAEEPENNIRNRRLTKPEGGTLTHPSIYTDGLSGRGVVDSFDLTAWDHRHHHHRHRHRRHRTVVGGICSKSLQCRPGKALHVVARGIFVELSSISEEEKKHFREYEIIRCENVVKPWQGL